MVWNVNFGLRSEFLPYLRLLPWPSTLADLNDDSYRLGLRAIIDQWKKSLNYIRKTTPHSQVGFGHDLGFSCVYSKAEEWMKHYFVLWPFLDYHAQYFCQLYFPANVIIYLLEALMVVIIHAMSYFKSNLNLAFWT